MDQQERRGASPVIGWYAHHQGAGHVTRAVAVAGAMGADVTILSSGRRPSSWPPERWVQLPDDAAPEGSDATAGGLLHWAPLAHDGFRDRMAVVAGWVTTRRPALVVSDVSVEVALLVRLLGVPVVVTVMAGDRGDRAHRAAYDAASALVAAWPPEGGPELVQGWDPAWDTKTTFVGAFSQFDRAPLTPPSTGRVAVLWGRGGSPLNETDLRSAREATPGWRWASCVDLSPDAVWAELMAASVVVTHAGQNALAEVAAARRPAVVVALPRPHDEQGHLLGGLVRMGLVTGRTVWPDADEWPSLLGDAVARPAPQWGRWSDGRGAARLARHLDELARSWS